jgi:hypothetical protein
MSATLFLYVHWQEFGLTFAPQHWLQAVLIRTGFVPLLRTESPELMELRTRQYVASTHGCPRTQMA